MARITNSPVGDIHGKIGGVVFFKTPQGQLARINTKPLIHASPALFNSDVLMSQTAYSWVDVLPADKLRYTAWGVSSYNSHSGSGLWPFPGNQVFNGCYKMYISAISKYCPTTYTFDSSGLTIPLSVSLPDYDSTMSFNGSPLDFPTVSGFPASANLTKFEISNNHFVKLRLDYPHTPGDFLTQDTFTNLIPHRVFFSIYCSGQNNNGYVRPNHLDRFLLCSNAFPVFPPLTFSTSQFVDIVIDFTTSFLDFNTFVHSYSWVTLGCSFMTEIGEQIEFNYFTTQLVDTFSW